MNHFDSMDSYAADCIRCRVRRLCAAGKIRVDEIDDLSQDALLEYYRRKPKFNQQRSGHKTFTSHVVKNAISTLMLRRRRETGQMQSFRSTCATEVVSPAPETRIAVEQALAGLPHRVRKVAEELSCDTPSGVARSVGASRTTIYEAKKQIRAALQQGGFGARKCRTSKPEVQR